MGINGTVVPYSDVQFYIELHIARGNYGAINQHKGVLQQSGTAVVWLFNLEKSQTARQGNSRTDAYLTNLKTGTG